MNKNRGDEPLGAIIHIYMAIPQGNSLCCYLYLKEAKCKSSFLFFLLKNQRIRGLNRFCPHPPGEGVHDTSERRKMVGKLGRRVNTVQKLCLHIHKCKNYT
jgi:hypothetical protein